jgi:hypothetical protein
MARAEDGSVGSAGSQNTAEGSGALQNLAANGVRNTAVGFNVLHSNTGGGANTALGAAALANNTANNNTACGSYALTSNTIGDGNTATGIDAPHAERRRQLQHSRRCEFASPCRFASYWFYLYECPR